MLAKWSVLLGTTAVSLPQDPDLPLVVKLAVRALNPREQDDIVDISTLKQQVVLLWDTVSSPWRNLHQHPNSILVVGLMVSVLNSKGRW
jgi:hypothetical protein